MTPPAPHHIEALLVEIATATERARRLSSTETDVLGCLAAGMSCKTAGHHLGISPRTVEIHRHNLHRALGATSFAQAVRVAVLAGVQPPAFRMRTPRRPRIAWTEAQDATILQMRQDGCGWTEIAAVVGYSHSTVAARGAAIGAEKGRGSGVVVFARLQNGGATADRLGPELCAS